MSRWPPEIAGTISHPAGRSAVTAERVPIFYSARSSSPSSPTHNILSLSLFSRSFPYVARRSRCVGPIQRLHENGPEPFPPRKERKGWQKMAGSAKEKQMPRQPRLIYATLYPVLLSPPSLSVRGHDSLASVTQGV